MTVHAAGGVVWRHTGATIEVLVVHRPTHDDWTFPKGKTERGDADLETTARREVLEESGHRCTVGDVLADTDYVDRKGRPKRVTYWEMRPIDAGRFRPNREVDDIRWVAIHAVERLLTYDRDRAVLAAFVHWHESRHHLSDRRTA